MKQNINYREHKKHQMSQVEMMEVVRAEQEKTKQKMKEDEEFRKRFEALIEMTRLDQEMGLWDEPPCC